MRCLLCMMRLTRVTRVIRVVGARAMLGLGGGVQMRLGASRVIKVVSVIRVIRVIWVIWSGGMAVSTTIEGSAATLGLVNELLQRRVDHHLRMHHIYSYINHMNINHNIKII